MKQLKWSKYLDIVDAGDFTVLYNSVSRGIYMIENNLMNRIAESIQCHMPPSDEDKEIIAKLYQQGFIVKAETNEIENFIEYRYKYYNNIFGTVLYVLPTLKCNFACPYCIQNEYTHNLCDEMSDETIKQLSHWICEFVQKNKDIIIESQSLNKESNLVKLVFFGGEPTLCNEKNWKLLDLLKERLPEWVKLSFTIITNGFGIDNDTLIKYKIRGLSGLQITLDGPPEIHDARRIPKDNTPTFCNILDTIKRSVDLGIKTIVRINIDESNVDSVFRLIELLNKNKLSGKLHLNIAPVDKNCATSVFDGHQQSVLEKFYDIFQKALMSNYTVSMWESFCGVYARSFFVVTPDGTLYKCPSLLNKEHAVGNVFNADFLPTYEQIINHTLDNHCYKCKYVGLCGGGCYNQNIMHGKLQCQKVTYENLVPAFCKSMGEYLRKKEK